MSSDRPLSPWTIRVRHAPDTVARWTDPPVINDGDERSDARRSPVFAAGWRRTAITLDTGHSVLGLVRDDDSEAAIELDELAMPLTVSREGAEVLADVDRTAPDPGMDPRRLAILRSEHISVRSQMLNRLAAEGRADAGLFIILPWELVDQLINGIIAMHGGAAPGRLVHLHHWFAAVGSRLAGTLEQLDEGLREADPELVRVAATALCLRLPNIVAARLPESTRAALTRLLRELRAANPFLDPGADRAIVRLNPGRADSGGTVGPLRVESVLPLAADTETGIRRETRTMAYGPFTLDVAVTATGRVEIVVTADTSAESDDWIDQLYGVMLLPVRVSGAFGPASYMMPIEHDGYELYGHLNLRAPDRELTYVEITGPPVGVVEAHLLDKAEVVRSIRAVRTDSALALWGRVASGLREGHPLRAVVAAEVG